MIQGIVQGVGFRPFVYSLAKKYKLTGKVWNTSAGVEILVTGQPKMIESFHVELRDSHPPLARIDYLESQTTGLQFFTTFEIVESQPDNISFIPISPDICICDDCRRELFNPNDHRFRYPFINCTNCGPRLTIIKDIPYDRPNTTMSGFQLCPKCLSEYKDPTNRRFHAQPVACSTCGPKITFRANGIDLDGEDGLQQARQYLKLGKIIAIKGLGGYHIACDASNGTSVSTLIERKHRSQKPLALMAFDIDTIRKYCEVSPEENNLLTSRQHPIVLLKKKSGINLPESIAVNQSSLGFLLPYTPLHLLLLEPEKDFPDVFVMTSGNLADEPIAYKDEDAINRLNRIVDGFLFHNREINIRVDDSVMRIFDNGPYFIRRSRGYAPDPIRTKLDLPEILACGAELKNTFCISKAHYAFISHHIGDLENFETLKSFEECIGHYQKLFRISPQLIATDLHPDYLSTKYAIDRSEIHNTPLIRVQHHHAHLAACLADNSWDSKEPVIGCLLDGTGLGTNGSIWGGEFLIGSYQSYDRVLHLKEVPLPGGDSSTRKPSKIGISYLHEAGIELQKGFPSVKSFDIAQLSTLMAQIEHRVNTPLTSSMGRLFDAVSSIIGIRQEVSYEAQAAIELENFCDPNELTCYEFDIDKSEINVFPMIRSIVDDWHSKVEIGIISAKFHNTVARICRESCKRIRDVSGLTTVSLSGGVWQNTTLLRKTIPILKNDGFNVLIHREVPANDGGISLGQLFIAAFSIFG
jgi:hydrogenase maturation protein HypF